jgi:hypothetical protein
MRVAGIITQRESQLLHRLRYGIIANDYTIPDLGDELIFRGQVTIPTRKCEQQLERNW